jgi:hypothetical protein
LIIPSRTRWRKSWEQTTLSQTSQQHSRWTQDALLRSNLRNKAESNPQSVLLSRNFEYAHCPDILTVQRNKSRLLLQRKRKPCLIDGSPRVKFDKTR